MEEKDPLKAIEEFPSKQKLNFALTEDAKKLAAELYVNAKPQRAKPKKVVFNSAILAIASCLILVLFLFPFFNAPEVIEAPPRFFEDVALTFNEVANIEEFILENNVKANYYGENELMGKSLAYYVETTKELVFLTQNGIAMSSGGFDKLEIGIVLTKDKFEKFDSFSNLVNKTTVQNISVSYSETLDNSDTIIKAYFEKDKVRYFLQIATKNPENKLNTYVEKLFS